MANAFSKVTKRISFKVISIFRAIFRTKKETLPASDNYKLTKEAYEAYRAELMAPILEEEAKIMNLQSIGQSSSMHVLRLDYLALTLMYFRECTGWERKSRLYVVEFDEEFYLKRFIQDRKVRSEQNQLLVHQLDCGMDYLVASAMGTFIWDSLDDMEFLEASASLWAVPSAAKSSIKLSNDCIMQSCDCGIDFLEAAVISGGLIFSGSVSDMELLEPVASAWEPEAILSDIEFLEIATASWSKPGINELSAEISY